MGVTTLTSRAAFLNLESSTQLSKGNTLIPRCYRRRMEPGSEPQPDLSQETETLVKRLAGPSSGKAGFVTAYIYQAAS